MKQFLFWEKNINSIGYIHVKTIPGASKELIDKLGVLVDRTSINIELPSNDSLKLLAPQKEKAGIVTPMKYISQNIAISKQEKSKYKEKFVPARANHTINCRSNTRNRFKNYEVIWKFVPKFKIKTCILFSLCIC